MGAVQSRLPRTLAHTPERRASLAASHRRLAAALVKAASLAEAVASELESEQPHTPTEAEWQDLGRP